ncbi:MAG: nucleotidyltransferase domain-containing protein [Chitinivibrionia bacterium]|nr:nucleotidyltransferase domain-containing protein [Chitinivibrionia bacterium]
MDKREDIILKAQKYFELVKASNFRMQIEKGYLFGSFAKGCPHEYSDIDVAFVVSNFEGGYLDTIVPVWKLRDHIDDRIEPHFIVPEEDYADFLPEIQRTGVELV